MQETLPVIIDYGFTKMKLHLIEAELSPENERSIKLLERNGFRKKADYENADSVIYTLINKSIIK